MDNTDQCNIAYTFSNNIFVLTIEEKKRIAIISTYEYDFDITLCDKLVSLRVNYKLRK